MQEEEYLEDTSYITSIKKKDEQQIEEFGIDIDSNHKTSIGLMKSFEEGQMGKDELYNIYISNIIALNLYQSLHKLKRGQNYLELFKSPCQIKIYPKSKLMIIYLVVSYHFLRIKTELQYIRENEKLIKNQNLNRIQKTKEIPDINESPILKINNEDEINENENEIIFTIGLSDFFKMLDLLLTENKDSSLVLVLDQYFSVLTAQFISPDVFNQMIYSSKFKFNLLKNDTFAYAISNPEKNTFKKKDISKKSKNNAFNKENNDDFDLNNDNSDINSKKENKENEKEMSGVGTNEYQNNQEFEQSQTEYLEKKFMMDIKSARYMIEGQYLGDLYFFMKGVELLYDNFATHNIGISMTNDKALFFIPCIERIRNGRYIEELSKNINQQLKLNIKSLINHSFTPFSNGFNSFYRTKFLSKFITSFYNKNDKRLLIKISPTGKMILSYTFSEPKNNFQNTEKNNEQNLNNSLTEDLNVDFKDDNEDSGTKKRKNIIKDGLLDDENMGNIVEMIFYPVVFDICKC